MPPDAAPARIAGATATGYSILAIASLLCSVCAGVGCIPGIICGHMARARIRQNPLLDGEGMATAGLAISYGVLGVLLVCGCAFALARERFKPVVSVRLSSELPAEMSSRVVDEVVAGQSSSESAHDMLIRGQMNDTPFTSKPQPGPGEAANSAPEARSLTQRTAMQGGSFGYRMRVLPDQPMSLNCLYWGGERAQRTLDIVVNDQIIATQELLTNAPGHFLDVEYKIPRSLTAGRNKVLVEFQAHPDLTSGRIFLCRTLKP